MISELNIFYLNLWRNPSYSKNQNKIHTYINDLADFIEYYLQSRYFTAIKVNNFWPYVVPKSYDDIKSYDASHWLDLNKQLQLYVGYDLALKPHEDLGNFAGYCECLAKGELVPGDFMYVDMPAYDALFGANIYTWYADFCRKVTHEIDHQMLRLAGDSGFVTKVHKAKTLPYLYWLKGNGNWHFTLNGTAYPTGWSYPFFTSQQDPQKVIL